MANPPPMPVQDPISTLRDWQHYPKPGTNDPNENLVTDPWIKWLQSSQQTIQASSQVIFTASAVDQSANIGTTAFQPGTFSAGLYRATFYARVTTASPTSSSLQTTFSWIDGSVGCSVTSLAMTGNTTSTVDSMSFMFLSDGNSPISYSTSYAHGPGLPIMVYQIYLTLERMGS
jgi:hypothetical protein